MIAMKRGMRRKGINQVAFGYEECMIEEGIRVQI